MICHDFKVNKNIGVQHFDCAGKIVQNSARPISDFEYSNHFIVHNRKKNYDVNNNDQLRKKRNMICNEYRSIVKMLLFNMKPTDKNSCKLTLGKRNRKDDVNFTKKRLKR